MQRPQDKAECERIIAAELAGVLVMSREGESYAVPMNHAFAEGRLYFHCAPTGRKLDFIGANPQVCFVVQRDLSQIPAERRMCHPDWESVIAYGAARVVEEREELRRAFTIFGQRFHPDFVLKEGALETTRAIIVEVESMTARQETEAGGVVHWSWSRG